MLRQQYRQRIFGPFFKNMNFIHVWIVHIKTSVLIFGQNMQLTPQLRFQRPDYRTHQNNVTDGTKTDEQNFFQAIDFLQIYCFSLPMYREKHAEKSF